MKDRCIPMESVSSAMVSETPDAPLVQAILYLVAGFIFYQLSDANSYYGNTVLEIIAVILIILGFVTLVSAILLLMGKRYMFRINVNNGQWIEYSTKKAGFVEDVLSAFCECVENKNACFVVDFSTSKMNREPKRDVVAMYQEINKFYGNTNIYNGNTNIYNGNATVMQNSGGINIAGDNSGEINQTVNGLRTEEWDKLLGYFDKKIETVTDEKARQMYEKMRDYAEKKDGKGFVRFLSSLGRTTAQTVVSGMTEFGLKQILSVLFQAVK